MTIFTLLLLLFLANKLSAERNIAQGKNATQSSTAAHHVAGFAVDGNIQTTSQTSSSPAPYWWEVDLQLPEKIDAIQIHFGRMYSVKASVFVSLDGKTWSLATPKNNNSTSVSYTTPTIEHFRYVRVERNNHTLVIKEVEIYRQPLSAEEKTRIPFKPSFMSEWYSIESHSSKSGITIRHDLNSTPIKVIADVKVEDNDNEYIFPGFGSAQTDDDTGKLYGGVVVLYDAHYVLLFAPGDVNNYIEAGKVIYLGSKDAWTGPNISRIYDKAKVRVRVWKTTDFPEPSFSSNWIYVQTGTEAKDTLYNEVHHSMNEYPDLVVVQVMIECKGHTYWFEGQGSTSVIDSNRRSRDISGAVFGYSARSVRIWFPTKNIGIFYTGYVFHAADGWGGINIRAKEGHYKILAWKFKQPALYSIEKHQMEPTVKLPFALSLQHMMVQVQFKVNEGLHSGFRFDGVGSSMHGENEYGPYGGLIYGINDKNILMWIPMAGYIFNFGGMWGKNSFHQATNNVNISIQIWTLFEKEIACPIDDLVVPNTLHKITSHHLRDSLVYQCIFGYRHSDGNLTRICQEDSTWSGKSPICKVIECPAEMMNTTATLVNITGNHYMDKATYTCPIHHRQGGGDSTRLCLSNSTWSGEPLICNRCRCPCKNETLDGIKLLMEQTKKQLTLDKQELTRFILKKISAKDDRIVAKGIGMTSGCILMVLFIVIFLFDAPVLYRQCKQAMERLCK